VIISIAEMTGAITVSHCWTMYIVCFTDGVYTTMLRSKSLISFHLIDTVQYSRQYRHQSLASRGPKKVLGRHIASDTLGKPLATGAIVLVGRQAPCSPPPAGAGFKVDVTAIHAC